DVENINLGTYLKEVCADAVGGGSACALDFDAVEDIQLDADRAVSLALLVNELVTNAIKHGLADPPDRHIQVPLGRVDDTKVVISVRDDGVGLPVDFDLGKSRGLGMRIVAGLANQLQAKISHRPGADGTEFVLALPLQQGPHG